ncbi:DNA cytosine methyltransferase [Cetobacterium sp.]|uniref:DNA cytosine methyltransferase n=1 Tax=Cetobacterium sp. TaxID=2071632 RepID=UPI002FC61482
MLKIATIFSGIGAVEQAALRLNINHKIIFACDNGGVNLYKKNRPYYLDEIIKKLVEIEKNINILIEYDKKSYLDLKKDLAKLDEKVKNDLKVISKLNFEYNIEESLNLLKEIKPKKFRNIEFPKNNFEKILILLNLKNYLTNTLLNSFNSELLSNLKTNLNMDNSLKEVLNTLKSLSSEIYRLDEIVNTQINISKLSKMSSYKEKKAYVNKIYQNYQNKNFVKKSYLSNYDLNEKDFHWNVSYLDGTEYKGKVDLFVGGSPCQSFSIAGKRKGLEDTRGTLFYEFIRLVKEIEPRFFIYENVKGLLSHDDGKTWKIVKECFDELGYNYTDKILNSKYFGIPQNRERIFVIGFKNKDDFKKFSMNENKELTHLLKDFLLDNNNLFVPNENINFINYEEKYKYPNLSHISFENWRDSLLLKDIQKKFVTSKEKQRKRYTQINGDIMLTQRACQQYNLHGDFIEYNMNKYFLSEKVKKYILNPLPYYEIKNVENHLNCDIAKTLVATSAKMHRVNIDNYISYGNEVPLNKRKIRRLHPRECFRLMGFCDSFKIVVSDTQAYHQAGNSIVVDVLIEILKGILKL